MSSINKKNENNMSLKINMEESSNLYSEKQMVKLNNN